MFYFYRLNPHEGKNVIIMSLWTRCKCKVRELSEYGTIPLSNPPNNPRQNEDEIIPRKWGNCTFGPSPQFHVFIFSWCGRFALCIRRGANTIVWTLLEWSTVHPQHPEHPLESVIRPYALYNVRAPRNELFCKYWRIVRGFFHPTRTTSHPVFHDKGGNWKSRRDFTREYCGEWTRHSTSLGLIFKISKALLGFPRVHLIIFDKIVLRSHSKRISNMEDR